jgi:hypothetical protein
VRNEARHIAEWLAYQFALGFDTVLLLDNMSEDATRDNALALAGTHDVRLLDWPLTGKDYQMRGYEFAVAHLENAFDWVAFFDTDEFLVLDPGVTLRDCLAARDSAAAIAVPWAIFGSAGHRAAPPGLVIEDFTYRSPPAFGPNQHIKSIIRPARMKAARNPHFFTMDGLYTDLAGREVPWMMEGVRNGTPDYRLGKLHHYFTRSWQHWCEKLRRGYRDISRTAETFGSYDLNDIFDDGAMRLAPEVRELLQRASG